MEKKVVSFRAEPELIEALEALQQPEDSSISQVALRLLRDALGLSTNLQPARSHTTTVNSVDADQITNRLNKLEETVNNSVNAVNTYELRDKVEKLEEQLKNALVLHEQLQETVNATVDERLQHPLDILSDHERRIKELESVPIPQPQQEDGKAIAPKRTNKPKTTAKSTSEDVLLPEAGSKHLSKTSLENKINSITRTLKNKGIAISKTAVKAKILELFPYAEDWISDDARKEVIKALEKQPTWEDKASDLLDEVKWQ